MGEEEMWKAAEYMACAARDFRAFWADPPRPTLNQAPHVEERVRVLVFTLNDARLAWQNASRAGKDLTNAQAERQARKYLAETKRDSELDGLTDLESLLRFEL